MSPREPWPWWAVAAVLVAFFGLIVLSLVLS